MTTTTTETALPVKGQVVKVKHVGRKRSFRLRLTEDASLRGSGVYVLTGYAVKDSEFYGLVSYGNLRFVFCTPHTKVEVVG